MQIRKSIVEIACVASGPYDEIECFDCEYGAWDPTSYGDGGQEGRFCWNIKKEGI